VVVKNVENQVNNVVVNKLYYNNMNIYHIIIKTIPKITHFYTFHALIYHILFLLGFIPSTKYIAYLVLFVSQIFNYISPKYTSMIKSINMYLLIDFIIHILPAIILYFYNFNKVPILDLSMTSFLLLTLIFYISYVHIYINKSVYDIYKDPFKYLNIKL
jgi:hypothetical protein